MAGRNFSLTPHLSGFVDNQVGSGRHQTASEVVREALRRYETALREDEARIAAIRSAIEQGPADIARGAYTAVTTAEDEAQLCAERTERAPTQRAAAK
jgi:antitoxin ParD1/3/4